jgi:uncharacterized membrane protein
MACFLTPTAAAIITASIKKKVSPKYHLEWLNTMLWGGVLMLIVDHIISGEVTIFPPFLTALKSPADIPVMLREIATVGGTMTAAVIIVWAIMVLAANFAERRIKNKSEVIKVVSEADN